MARVMPPDLELWVADYLRDALAAEGRAVQVGNKEPAEAEFPLAKPLVVIRDDSGVRQSVVTFDRSLGVSVLAGTRSNDRQANDLARLVASILMDDGVALVDGSPVAAVQWDGCNGPYAVTDSLDVARRYMTVEYTVVGSW